MEMKGFFEDLGLYGEWESILFDKHFGDYLIN